MFKTIIVGVDGCEGGRYALALELEPRCSAELRELRLHTLPP